jgi:hypothetical protein
LIPFLENNPTSKIGPGPKADAAFILRPWGDETMTLEIPQGNNEISEILNNVIMPERYSALRHLKTGDLEVIFSAYPLPVSIADVKHRNFRFIYKLLVYSSCGVASQSPSDIVENMRGVTAHGHPRIISGGQ